MPDQCCGTCKWFEETQAKWAWCTWPSPVVPKSISHMVREVMMRGDSTDCPCYSPKEPK